LAQKKKSGNSKYTAEFKRSAVERMQHCDSVTGLARELGICWSSLYEWRNQLRTPVAPKGVQREEALKEEVRVLKLALADKTLEVDFFKGALQKVEARRQKTGGVASTTRSGK
jgi:transposase-like protein